MAMAGWKRPALCLLCKCPAAADSAVRVDALDAEKLSKWWGRTVLSDLNPDDVKHDVIFCEFCVWQAKLEYEHSDGASAARGYDWWTAHATSQQFYQHFFLSQTIQPCKVVLEPLRIPKSCAASPSNQAIIMPKKKRGRPGKPSQCSHCGEHFSSKTAALQHEEKHHQAFPSQPNTLKRRPFDRKAQYQKFHRVPVKPPKQKALLKCNFDVECSAEFKNCSERSSHLRSEHFVRQSVVCIYCNNNYTDKECLNKHVNLVHPKIKIKCSIKGCCKYFFNKQNLDAHFQLLHQAKEDLKVFCCSKCSFRTSSKSRLSTHIVVAHGWERLQCPKCIRICRSRVSLQSHLRDVHMKRRSCKFCNALVVNINRHMSQRQCKKCDFVSPCSSLSILHATSCTVAAKNK